MKFLPDIDIDFADRDEALELLDFVPASRYDQNKKELVKHNVGVYFQDIPKDPITGLASIPYKEAEERGYFKVDFLNLEFYKDIKNELHLQKLIDQEPIWELLEDEEFVSNLNQIHSHFDVVDFYKPKSVLELAMVIALIRPGKKHLIGKSFDEIKNDIWIKSEKYDFKKAHAISYAQAIAVQMNLLIEPEEEVSENFTKESVPA